MQEITPQTVSGINHSDPIAFRRLYDAYYAYLCGLAVSYIHDFEKARELVNDVFLRVWERRASLKYPPLPYLISGIRNACFNYLRDSRKVSELSLSLMDKLPEAELYQEADVEEIMQLITMLSARLPERCAEVFSLHFYQGMDTAEIADRLGVTPSTVRVQLKIALDRIRESLKR